jgi:starch-binding outer membrane protein SusE/F
MKKISIILFLMLGLLSVATSCKDGRDDNPRYQDPTTFVLNTPKYANGEYDLKNTSTIQLTCSQPDYGYAAPVEYYVQVSRTDNNWDKADSVQTLSTPYTTCKMDVDAAQLDLAICQTLNLTGESDMPTGDIPVYIRLKANVTGMDSSVIYSNSIKLPNVKAFYSLPDVVLPTSMYMVGKFCSWNWEDAAEMVPANDNSGNAGIFWCIRYVKAGEGFKFNAAKAWDGGQFGFGGDNVKIKNSVATVTADADGNFTIDKTGWFIFMIRTTIVGRTYNYAVDILDPNVYIYGWANGGTWANSDDWKFTVDNTNDGTADNSWPFVSPAVPSTPGDDTAGCLRIAIHPTEWSNIDWWRTEFIFFDNKGSIEYRGTGSDQKRASNIAGKVYLNFVKGLGKVE